MQLWCDSVTLEYSDRDISGMLSKEWHKLSESEKRPFQTKARVKAELQKAQHPDCWKRKH